jgi:hypothetical protein
MKVVNGPVLRWRHDLAGCLHACAATLLAHHGFDPLDAIGAAWGFDYRPGEVRREEYYFPLWRPSLLESMAPYHAVRSVWHEPDDAKDGWEQVRSRLVDGALVAAAVDNFHLPFRPAYRDVHTNHMLVVYGFDDVADTAWVLDAVPPGFQGEIPLTALTQARDSANRADHSRDLFFTDNAIHNRWLEVEVTGDSAPADFPAPLPDVLTANLTGFIETSDNGWWRGLAGLTRYRETGVAAVREGTGRTAVDEMFVVAGAHLARTGVHADYLRHTAARLGQTALAVLARRVDRIAHHWAALRIVVARADRDEGGIARLANRFAALESDLRAVLDDMRRYLDALS